MSDPSRKKRRHLSDVEQSRNNQIDNVRAKQFNHSISNENDEFVSNITLCPDLGVNDGAPTAADDCSVGHSVELDDLSNEEALADNDQNELNDLSNERARQRREHTGVVYLSSIPPYMPPAKIESLLAPFGEIGRVYLVPEDEKSFKKRRKFGGCRKRRYIEGWVEFKNKRSAKNIAKQLNGQPVGGRRGSFWSEDIWTIKYLRGFKWDHLVAQIAEERREREMRLKMSISQALRENKHFVAQLEKHRMIHGIEAKRAAKGRSTGESEHNSRNSLHQREPIPADGSATAVDDANSSFSHKKRVLSEVLDQIF